MKFGLLIAVLSALTTYGFSQDATAKSVLGYLEPYRSIDMNASESGVISEIFVEEGSSVEEGQALISLNNSVLEAQLAIAEVQSRSESAIVVANADLEVSKDRFAKLSRLKNQGTAHSSEVARAEADVKKAEAQLNIANEEKKIAGFRVEEIQAQIERRILRSPIDGVVLEINREISETATDSGSSHGSKPLVRVAKIDRLRLVVHVPASLVDHLVVGKELPVKVLQQNSLSADRGATAIETTGKIEFVSPAIDPSSETIRARLVIENEDQRLLSGSHAIVLFADTVDG
ncbi:MAG: hypothetical protein CMO55_26810 [Verrucomicrobiales bacterium]|nr:hypothetical protein [Verrucomicrobiales bacterium]